MRRDSGSEVIEVYPQVRTTDEYGNPVWRAGNPDTDIPIIVTRCRVQPVTSDADASQGLALTIVYRILCADFPGGARSLVRWRGEMFSVKETPAVHRGSSRTAHDTVYMHSMGPIADRM